MENDDYVPSDIEDIEEDDVSINEEVTDTSNTKIPVPTTLDDDDNQVDDVDIDADDDSINIDSDEDYDDINDEEDIINRIQKEDNINTNFIIDSDDDEDDDDYDEDYLQKINDATKNDIITNFHPELHSHNNDEIQTLSKVVRDNNGTIVDTLHKTLPFVTKYEKARILGERAKQLNAGAQSFVEVDDNVIDGYLIALKEFEEKKVPFIIKRPLPNGGCEYWKLQDLEILV